MSNATVELEAVKNAIAARSRSFEARFAAGDPAGLVDGYFVEDSLSPMASPPGAVPPVRGRAALTGMFAAQLRDVSALSLETLHVAADGDLAYELGRAHLTLRAGPQVIGRYTVLWQRVHGEWRAQIDFFAADGWAG